MQARDTDQARADLALLLDAARAAADLALGFHGKDPQVWHKPDEAGPVSEADLAVDTLLRDHLTAARPSYGWLSEETPDSPARLSCPASFIIDPIDGTRAFVAAEKGWGHSLAIAHGGQVTAGVVLMPLLNKCYTAALGCGAHLNDTPLTASTNTDPDAGKMLARRPQITDDLWPGGPPAMKLEHRSPMAYRLACLAEGRFDATFVPKPIWEWDLAAGALLLTESGHAATDPNGAPLQFNAKHPRAPGLLAANPALHAQLLARR
ncbi:3'(2'),5'-bisphosphate nucleotidase CysQ [Meridianimarinicoccus aquatilis]|uniref:3'(2'),5'-bisphosphate nucleotidase CysQ n=1 Tax=Meridianimarinicoccus aquatilis TaxID=2552766 RepID=A0A4R6AZU4_9RHOB|nr:3'(2'),5'-bisphosphate nucleotidase CysQ [Fluviibacterium aquatile]TDL89365.1 3'(2'),5'-bisphosphate nucleotidase CysQ [Fluviibacterium aquatile]